MSADTRQLRAGHIIRPHNDRSVYTEAVCAGAGQSGRHNPWYPSGNADDYAADTFEAKRLCLTCPHQEECAEWALAHPEEYGVWGGLDEAQRRTIRRYRLEGRTVDLPTVRAKAPKERPPRKKRAGSFGPAPKPIEHGTVAGYYMHRKRKVPACEPCRLAAADYRREHRQAKRAAMPINCGTAAGEMAHRRRGEQPCPPCRRAASEARRKRKARGRALTAVPTEATG